MAYSAPPTFVAGDPLAAAELNVISDDVVYLYGVAQGVTFTGVRPHRDTAQSIPDATDTPVVWESEVFDYGGWWSSGTDIVVPAGAIPAGFTTVAVSVILSATFAANGTGIRRVQLLINGSVVDQVTIGSLSGDATAMFIPTFAMVEAADVITMQVHQTSGGALNLSGCNLTVVRYAPAA